MNLPLAQRYDEAVSRLPGRGDAWLDSLRREGIATYGRLGLPGPKVEAWKYTNLNRLRRTEFVPSVLAGDVSLDTVPTAGVLALDAPRIVLVNGILRRDLSDLDRLPAGIGVTGLAALLESDPASLEGRLGDGPVGHDMPLLALNAAYLGDGVVISIEAGADVKQPVHLVSLGIAGETPVAFHPRTVIRVGRGARATVIESHTGQGGAYLSNGATEIRIEDDAVLEHRKLQHEAASAFHLAATTVLIGARSTYDNFTLQVGGRLARNEIHARFEGRGAECRLYGSYAGRGDQHIDNTTNVDHAVPECISREVYKGALDDNARGVFQGKILVRKNAQKTDGHQLNKALLLSPGAEIDSKPELEIYADDVKCSHGATAGELDEEQLFYLCSRGIGESEARDLLVAAFLEDGLAAIGDGAQADAFRTVISGWLAERRKRQEG